MAQDSGINHRFISIRGGRHHNLKNINIDIPHGKLVVITGPSGSGKSSLAMDTIYGEGQRRYMESISGYARQFLTMHAKPDADSIDGLSPSIAIDQNSAMRNPRSTVATVTEIQDYLRVLFARVGVLYSPATGLPIKRQSVSSIVECIMDLPIGTKLRICAPVVRNKGDNHTDLFLGLQRKGFERIKINGKQLDISSSTPKLDPKTPYTIEVVVDRIMLNDGSRERVVEAIESAAKLASGCVGLDIVEFGAGEHGRVITEFTLKDERVIKTGDSILFSGKFACPVSDFEIESIEPKIFSFNSPYGACEKCCGIGLEISFKRSLIVPDENKTLRQGAIEPWVIKGQRYYTHVLDAVARHYGFSLEVPFCELSKEHQEILFSGSGDDLIEFIVEDGYCKEKVKRPFIGAIAELESIESDTDGGDVEYNDISKYRDYVTCRKCDGYRLKPSSLCVKINGKHIGEVSSMSIDESLEWFEGLNDVLTETQKVISAPLLKDICDRLRFLIDVGLEYLTLSRSSSTLSGGEAQRIRLASQIGSKLSGVTYVLDEPTIGLHQSDNQKLTNTLKQLRDIGNTVIVVEHDTDTIMAADFLVDVGPCAGELGGYIMSAGTVEEVMKDPNSITGAFLSGREEIPIPEKRRKVGKRKCLEIIGATENNLKNVHLKLPLGMFIAVTGVSGGGKSTLVIDTMYRALMQKLNGSAKRPGKFEEMEGTEYISKVIKIDQTAIGRTPRSNPATFIGVFTLIRDLFTALPASKVRGYKSSRFSFNVKGGRCEHCKGDGVLKIEMHFMPEIYVECDVCKGKRYNAETLEIKYNGKTIADVLAMTVSEALEFFKNFPSIREKFAYMERVGLGYIRIGQSATTLSGGEAQRIKLAKELSQKTTGDALYILDEPTTGLHTVDIKRLIQVMQDLVDAGNTVLVIEHNIDVIKSTDYILDIGPKGGRLGGYIVAEGTPEEVANNPASVTGPYIKPCLKT